MSTVLVPVSEWHCQSCGSIAQCPYLPGEHRYGDFIAHGERSTVHAYLNVMEGSGQQVWDCVESVVKDHGLTTEVTVRLCDPIDGQSLSLQLRCPACGSCTWTARRNQTTLPDIEIPTATFAEFSTSTEAARFARVNAIARQVQDMGVYTVPVIRPRPWPSRLMQRWQKLESAGLGPLFAPLLRLFRRLARLSPMPTPAGSDSSNVKPVSRDRRALKTR
jgi:hypothetical protein